MTLRQWDQTNSAATSAANPTVTISNALTSGDVYLVIDIGTYDNTSQHGTAVSGLGVTTWTRLAAAQTTFADVWIGQGTSNLGSGQVLTLTAPLLTSGYGYRRIIVYCFRGVTTTATAAVASGSSTTVTTANLTIDAGQAAVAFGISDTASDSLKSLTPGTGWGTIQNPAIYSTFIYGGHSYREPSSSATHTASASRVSGAVAVHMVRLGDSSAPPLSSTFVGWGNPIF